MAKGEEIISTENRLGAHLALLRRTTRMSLRQVEEATGKEVSNAYLSQLENGKITKPSPNILHALALVYNAQYEDLMQRAGYLSAETDSQGRRRAKVATFPVGDLTAEEEESLLEYLAMLRKRIRK